ncbi:MAG: thioredoxin domain-containing protein [Candidatus Falkowbacteria bacterium]
MKKSSYIWGGAIFLLIVIAGLFIIKASWQKNPDKANTDLGNAVKAESFAPTNSPTISADEKIIGSISAPIKVLVYEDYSNSFSADAADSIKKLETDFGDKLVIAFRPYATREKPASIEAAMAVECAADQEKWSQMREAILKDVKNSSLNSDQIKADATAIGLDQAIFGKCLTDVEKQGIMLQVATDAKQFSVYGAPTIFVNNELVVGARPYEDYLDEFGAKVEGLKSLVTRQIK